MKRHKEKAATLLRKARQDEYLLDAVISNSRVADEIFGFHAQQAVEKGLKALLSHSGVLYKFTHNLRDLMELLEKNGQTLPKEFFDMDRLTPYGTLARYEEGDPATPLDRKNTRELVKTFLSWVEQSLK